MPSRDVVRAALLRAERQSGVLTTAQLERSGLLRSWVAHQVRTGRWQRLHQGVVVAHSGPVDWRTRAWAALLYAGPGAALSHASAARL
ncbi:MAG: type IV toxin-antitoxin system AbiEi family antitoxin domain-containing protein, partial [Actinotalea sp.]|nr:type IV toxin-antitoxin system AbiEi family antitoxin domain-containing protein [Actinotalea sp.]